MPSLKNSHVNPSLMPDTLGQREVYSEASHAERRALEESLDKWTLFEQSATGEVCAKLAQPKIDNLNRLLSLSLAELSLREGFTVEIAREQRAMWRGQREVWMEIRTGGRSLKSQLEELESEVGKPKKRRLGWLSLPEKEKQA